ncbi:hypothetical protein COL8621_01749 [Actibacterium lipolyticum]|uniref:Uncharacterized protein n=1 Tax=Actibacterium lipolyticum TaxID=1524263 RepID=A0A238JXB4_9RHOB|nr:hypothetical protein COL8621_01749 [Actibacterium lipolyticum]
MTILGMFFRERLRREAANENLFFNVCGYAAILEPSAQCRLQRCP